MAWRNVIGVFLIALSTTLAQNNVQNINSQIWSKYCTTAQRANTYSATDVFRQICSPQDNAISCCNTVARIIQTEPNKQICASNNGYHFDIVGCGLSIGSRGSFQTAEQNVPNAGDFRFPIDVPIPTSPIRPSTNQQVPQRNGPTFEIVFSQNPQDNIRVGTSQSQPNRVASSQPSQQQVRPTNNFVPARNPNPVDTDSYEDDEENAPPVVLNSPGYKAMQFALNLFKKLDRPPNGDSVISPLLPQQLLSNLVEMASPVAQNQLQNAIGLYPEQLDQLTRGLKKVSKSTVNTIETAAVNFVARNVRLNRTYEESIRLRNVDILKVDFAQPNQAARIANNWVSDKTHRFINEIVNPSNLDPNTRLLLANTIYFKGKWKYAFLETEPAQFESSHGNSRQVNQMYQLNKLRYGELKFPDGNGFRWVEIPYEGDQLAMLIMLPRERHQLEASLRQMQPEDLARVMAQMQVSYIDTKVHLRLPKFTLTDTVSLIPALQRLGVYSIFQDGESLRHLANEPMTVSDVTQRSYMSVDEFGTTATSVASLSIVTLSVTPQYRDVRFTVDEPFLAMIVDKQERYPLFIGQVYEPRE